jgi:lectin family protein
MKSRYACLPAAIAVAGGLLSAVAGVAVPQAQAQGYVRAGTPTGDLLYQQSFAGASVPSSDWISGGTGGKPCLTAGGGSGAIGSCGTGDEDAAGAGALRLTSNQQNQTGYVLYTHPLQADRGLNIAFNMYQYNTTTKGGADGIAFILVNGTSSPTKAGDFGGALGYKGLAGGYLGVGFDEWGNFSNTAIFGAGKGRNGRVPNSIVVRGAQSAGYPYLDVKAAAHPLADDAVRTRGAAMHHVVIQLSTSGLMSVSVSYGKQTVQEISDLDMSGAGQPALPPTVKFAIAASTGANTDIHAISGLTITALPPDLQTAISTAGNFQAGGAGTLTATVLDKASAGPTTGPTTSVISLPQGLVPTSAQGTGWTCTVTGPQVDCSRPDLLQPGDAFPPITVTTGIASNVPPQVNVAANATTPESPLASGHASVMIPVAQGPNLSTTLTPVGQFQAPGVGTYLLTVANGKGAGVTSSTITETMTVPNSQTATAATGNGWQCSISGQTVTCTTPGQLAGGQSLPPIAVTVQTAALQLNPTAQVSTPDDAGQPGETSPPVSVQITPVSTSS